MFFISHNFSGKYSHTSLVYMLLRTLARQFEHIDSPLNTRLILDL